MLDIFKKWYKRYLSEEESVLVLVLLAIAVALFMTIGDILKPVVAAIVLAHLAQGVSGRLQRYGLPQWLGVAVSYLAFVGIFFGFSFALLPLVKIFAPIRFNSATCINLFSNISSLM